tara:strand:- start:191 stop:679 length:489 start_codon:yes stop_codon:yes gene_type:complete
MNYSKSILSMLTIAFFAFMSLASGDDSSDATSTDDSETSTDDSETSTDNSDDSFTIDPAQLSELNEYLQRSSWVCTNVEKGTAPFMKGATFTFYDNSIRLTSGTTTVQKDFEITGILPDYPAGAKYSALINYNGNTESLTWISDNLMLISWFNDKAKLRLQR